MEVIIKFIKHMNSLLSFRCQNEFIFFESIIRVYTRTEGNKQQRNGGSMYLKNVVFTHILNKRQGL